MHDRSCFITLTYDGDNVPSTLIYSDFQKFMKRLRKKFGAVRFYMCGEYGEQFDRPHFHACLFGIDFSEDRVVFKELSNGRLYVSKSLESLWSFGFSSIGDVTIESAAYVAGYVMKKITGDMAEDHYKSFDPYTGEIFCKEPEFSRMSLKPGIGAKFAAKYGAELVANGFAVVSGKKCAIPKFYDSILQSSFAKELQDLETSRIIAGASRWRDGTEERLKVQESVAKARVKSKVRSLQ